MITALELLASIHEIPPDRFPHLRRQVEYAFALSNGRILEEPLALICKGVLHIPFPLTAPAENIISSHLDIVRRAATLQQILEGRIPFKGGPAGFKTTSAIDQVVSGPKSSRSPPLNRSRPTSTLRGVSAFKTKEGDYHLKCAENSNRRPSWLHRKEVSRIMLSSDLCDVQHWLADRQRVPTVPSVT